MKKLMELMAEELASAFEKAGYDPEYGKVTVSNRPDLCEYQCNGERSRCFSERQQYFFCSRGCKTRIYQFARKGRISC